MNGIQFYVELLDDDSQEPEGKNNELIDRFAINITGNVTNQIYTGIFNLTSLELTITVKCAKYFYGKDCEKYCAENCAEINGDGTSSFSITITMITIVTGLVLMLLFCLTISLVITYYKYKKVSIQRQEAPTPNILVNQPTSNEGQYNLEVRLDHSALFWWNCLSCAGYNEIIIGPYASYVCVCLCNL